MNAYYNENDPFAAEWLRNLIRAGHIAPGEVDERSIVDVRPGDLERFTQCHFFAGIGGWSLALRLAGWPDDRPVWTGSCPCQPFSAAGAGKAADDERHLWPAWFPLIAECGPPVIFGEQVEAAIGWGWLDAVFADLEGEDYACGATDISAAGVGAPHIRQRLWWVADAGHAERRSRDSSRDLERRDALRLEGQEGSAFLGQCCEDGRLAHNGRIQRKALDAHERQTAQRAGWIDCDWLPCRDGKARPVEPGTFPLVAGLSFKLGSGQPFEGKSRVGMLRGYGNAIVPQVAAEFIGAFLEAEEISAAA